MATAKDVVFYSWNDSKVEEENARLMNIQKLIDYYNGDHKRYLEKYLRLKDLDDFPFYETNITKRIIRKVAEVYKKAPARYFGDDKNDKYEELTRRKDSRMKLVERQSRLLGLVGVRPYINQKGIFDYQILRAFTVYLNGITPKAIKYLIASEDDEIYYEYWSNETHYILDSDNVPLSEAQALAKFGIETGENSYIPFVWCHSEFIIDDFYNTGGCADDLVNANEQIDLMLSEMCHKYRYTAFNPIYITGNIDAKDIEYNYNKILLITDPEGSVGTLNINHAFADDIEAIKFQMQLIERNYNLNINWGIEGAPSGFSLIVQNIDHREDLENMIEICREWEYELYEMEKRIALENKIKLPKESMRVNFTEVDMPISIEEQNKKWTFEFQNQLASKGDYLRANDPDISDEEIEAKLKAIAKEGKMIKETGRTEPTLTEIFQ